MAKSPEQAMQSMIDGLKEKTGRTLPEWTALAKKSSRQKHGELVAFLKSEHGIGHGYANLIAHQTLQSDSVSVAAQGVDLVAEQYAGAKAGLRPIYDALAARVKAFGDDVDLSAKKTYVSLRRKKQFAIVQPSTATRVDVGINLKGEKPQGRLEASGSFNAMVSHRVRLESVKDVDAQLVAWLRLAYEQA
jgi:hypothetical protein